MAGTTEDELMLGNKSLKVARVRFPWLLITFFGELVSGLVIHFFHGKVQDFAILASFMPLIMAMGGNVGSQSATILIRGVALGKIDMGGIYKVIFKEIRVGMIMGLVLGSILSFIAPFFNKKQSTWINCWDSDVFCDYICCIHWGLCACYVN